MKPKQTETPEQAQTRSAVEDAERRRKRLAEEYAELQWDLGGLAYEMAARDHFRPDVLVRRAGRLQEVDAELGQVERLLKLERAGAAGTCTGCGAHYGRGAGYCWRCGTELIPARPAGAASGAPWPV